MNRSLSTSEHERLVAWLKKQRTDKGVTMRDLAVKLEVAHSFIGKVEQSERRLDVVEYLAYCKALEVSPIEGLKVLSPDLLLG